MQGTRNNLSVILMAGICMIHPVSVNSQARETSPEKDDRAAALRKIEITGNWHQGSGFLPHIQAREPALKEGEHLCFSRNWP